jgi:hypothetical protein
VNPRQALPFLQEPTQQNIPQFLVCSIGCVELCRSNGRYLAGISASLPTGVGRFRTVRVAFGNAWFSATAAVELAVHVGRQCFGYLPFDL